MSEVSRKPSKRRIVLVVVLAVAACFFGISWWEKDKAAKIEALLQAQGEFSFDSLKVGFWGKSITILGLKGSAPYVMGGKIRLEAGSVHAVGANFDALESAGVVPLADSVQITDYRNTVEYPPQSERGKQSMFIKSYSMDKVRGDARLLEEMGRKTQDLTNPETVARYFASAGSIRTGVAIIAGYESTMDVGLPTPMVLSMESFRSEDYGAFSHGAAKASNIAFSVMGEKILTVGSLSTGRLSMPDALASPLLSGTSEGFEELPRAMAALDKEPLVVRDIEAKDVSFRVLFPEAVTLKSCFFDLEMNGNRVELKSRFADMLLPSSYYRYSGREAGEFAKVYGAPLNFSGALEFLLSWKDGRGELLLKDSGLTEKNLGEVHLDMNLLFEAPGMDSLGKLIESGREPEAFLKNGRVVLEDRHFLGILFKGMNESDKKEAEEEGRTPETLEQTRAWAVRSVRSKAEQSVSPDRKAVLEGLAKLVEGPGRLEISFAPDSPRSLDHRAVKNDVSGAYKATVRYTPRQQ